jgi:hypothetical protein
MPHSLSVAPTTHAAIHALARMSDVDLRARIVSELALEHLDEAEQNQIIDALGEVLLERATFEVINALSEDQAAELDSIGEDATDLELQNKLREWLPQVDTIVGDAVRAGIAEHKQLVSEAMESETE